MSDDAAIIQIVKTLQEQLTVTDGPGIFIDRDDAEPIQPAERPAKVIRVTDETLDEMQEMGRGAQLHIATIDIDHYEDSNVTDNLNSQLANEMAATVALIGADDKLGSKVFELTFVSAIANADDVPDAGVAILTMQVKYLTELYDWTTIIF
jgi:hypothetical protein